MKRGYRAGRPKGVKNGESTTHKGKLWNTEEEKEALWKQAEKKVNEEYGDSIKSANGKGGTHYQSWYVHLQPEELDNLTNDELMEVIYKYKGNYSLWLRGTKEKDFKGKYGKK